MKNMRLSKNILILLGSYLGMLLLVCCTAQFLIPLSADGGETEVNGGAEVSELEAGVTEPADIPVAVAPDGEESTEASVTRETEGSSGETDAAVSGDTDAAEVLYCLKLVPETGNGVFGIVGVYAESGELLRTVDVPVLSLPSADRARLESGITVSGDAALATLIEDLGG